MTRGVRRPLLRIQAGKWKRRPLRSPASARPTSGRARAAFFDLLGPDRIAGARVLDLFAGSGAVGLEALSRGARRAVLVEPDGSPIAEAIHRLDADAAEVRLLQEPVDRALAALERAGEQFDVVFADPPYAAAEADGWLDGAARLLAPGGRLVVQSDTGRPPRTPAGLARLSGRSYGRNVFHFFGML